MKWLSSAWKWLSGKKTALGAAMLIASKHIDEPLINSILTIGGEILAGSGLAHKLGKSDLPSGLRKVADNIKSLAKK